MRGGEVRIPCRLPADAESWRHFQYLGSDEIKCIPHYPPGGGRGEVLDIDGGGVVLQAWQIEELQLTPFRLLVACTICCHFQSSLHGRNGWSSRYHSSDCGQPQWQRESVGPLCGKRLQCGRYGTLLASLRQLLS